MFTSKEIELIRESYPGRNLSELTDLFAARFGDGASKNQISSAAYRYGARSGRNRSWFMKEYVPLNTAQKRINIIGKKLQFAEKSLPPQHQPVGAVLVSGSYWYIKVADPNVWQLKHQLVWEAANGPIPDNHVVVFADGDSENFTLDNLLLISRAELLIMNRNRLFTSNADLTKAGVGMAKLKAQNADRKWRRAKAKQRILLP